MCLRRWIFSVLAAVCIVAVQAETAGRLTPVSQQNVLDLLPTGLRAPEQRVLDVAVAGDSIYFLVGLPYSRPENAAAILRVGSDGSRDAMLLPPGEVRSLSVDAESNVHALMLPDRRGAEPKMLACLPSLVSCTAATFADGGRQIWARQSKAGHLVELSFDGALFVDGERLLAAPRALPEAPEPTRLLAAPGQTRTVYLNQVSGALSVIDPTQPSRLQSANIRGVAIEAAKGRDRVMRAGLPAQSGSGGLTIYAAALGADGSLFVALSPYNQNDGALIIQTSLDGTTQRAVHCALPKDQAGDRAISPAHIGVSGNNLVLISGYGDVLTYRL